MSLDDLGGHDDELVDLVEDALPPDIEEDALPLELNALAPWHRPRKQSVRERQWIGLTRDLISRLKLSGALQERVVTLDDGSRHRELPELRYLTLPGLDYLDARLLGATAQEEECRLTLFGFLDDASNTRVLARARVRQEGLVQSGHITTHSITLPRKFESICYSNGDTLGQIRRTGPYHVVNIDACGSVAPRNSDQATRLIEAIHKLVEVQVSSSTSRWLMFLTVDVRMEDMDEETFEFLCEAIRRNAGASVEFAAAASDLFGPGTGQDFEGSLATARAAGPRSTLDVFSVGIAKWLLHMVDGRHWSVRLKRSFCYSTTGAEDGPATMCSLAIEFIPPGPGLVDPVGASRQPPALGGPQGDAGLQIVEAVSQLVDLDALLAADDALTSELNLRTRELLLEAGYQGEALRPLEDPLPLRFPDIEGGR